MQTIVNLEKFKNIATKKTRAIDSLIDLFTFSFNFNNYLIKH